MASLPPGMRRVADGTPHRCRTNGVLPAQTNGRRAVTQARGPFEPFGTALNSPQELKIMARYPMTEIIARREYNFLAPTGHTKVIAALGKPAIMSDDPNRNWYWRCSWEFPA
jgi:hypothetical protein